MTSSKRWKTVVDVAGIESDKAAQGLQQSRQQQTEQQHQLEQLLQFQEEYKERLASLGEQGLDAGQLQNYRLFLSQLGDAVSRQTQRVEAAGEQVGQQQQTWLAQYHRKCALENVFQSAVSREQQARDKSEQKEIEDNNSKDFCKPA